MTATDRDLQLLADYLEGRMRDESERMRFELRLSDEPELARAHEAYASVDALARLGRREADRRSARVLRPRLSVRSIFTSVLAVAAAALLWMLLRDPTRPPIEPQPDRIARVGVFAGGRGFAGVNGALRTSVEELDELDPFLEVAVRSHVRSALDAFDSDLDSSVARGGTSAWSALTGSKLALARLAELHGLADPLDEPADDHPARTEILAAQIEFRARLASWSAEVDRYLGIAPAIAEARAARSLGDDAPLQADFFHVAFEAGADCSILLFLVDDDGRLFDGRDAEIVDGPAWPDASESWSADRARFAAGATAVLPAPPLGPGVIDGIAVVRTSTGFLRKRNSSLRVLVAVRAAPLDEGLRTEMRFLGAALNADAAEPDAALERLRSALHPQGFEMSVHVVEPQ